MSTYTKLVNHFTFSTKGRSPFLTEDIRDNVFAYIGGIIRSQRCASIIVNGVDDHVHILAHVRPTISVSDFMQQVKKASSEFAHNELRLRNFAWQEGYAAFSVRGNDFGEVVRYIESQAEHHRKERYEFELRRLLVDAGLEWNEEYLLG